MTFTDDIADPPSVVGQKLASAVFSRMSALTDELLKCVLKQGEACGNQSDIYGDGRLVPIDDLYHSLQDNLEFILSNLGCPGRTIWPPRGEPAGGGPSRRHRSLRCRARCRSAFGSCGTVSSRRHTRPGSCRTPNW